VNRPKGKASAWKCWLAAAGLLLPVVGLYAAHYAHGWAAGDVPTGFIQYDMAGYMAAAREHFDGGRFTLTYGNPASASPDAPRIYFQPMTLLLGVLVRLTGEDPGAVFVAFGLAAGLVAVRLAIAVFEELVGLDSPMKKLALACFVWGGGLLAASGALFGLITGRPVAESLWRFDPNEGWWFLNLGRNLIYPTEALYHALALGCLLALLRRRFVAATLLLAVLSASHPFTGIQVIGIVVVWMILERVFGWRQPTRVPLWALAAVLLLGAAHVGYYLVYLPRFEEHAVLVEQWRLPAVLRLENMLPAYALVGALAVWRCRRWALCRKVFSDPRNRLLGIWFAVSFLLANHEWFLTAHQPLHFTRGYLWMPLFLLGAPVLVGLLGRKEGKREGEKGEGGKGGEKKKEGFDRDAAIGGSGRRLRPGALVLVAVLLMDNAVWFAVHSARPMGSMYLECDERRLLTWIGRDAPADTLLLADPPLLAYLATVYAPHRAWYSHWANTPHAEQRKDDLRKFLETGAAPEGWKGRSVLILSSDRGELRSLFEPASERRPALRPIYREETVTVWRVGSLAGR
jgi:hypothetical protein